MSLIGAWLRMELRHRWPSLAVLTLLIAVACVPVLAAFAGARRGDTALDRLTARTLPATASVQMDQPGFDWTPVRALPEVAGLATYVQVDVQLAGIPIDDLALTITPGDDELTRTLERPVVVDGRLADPRRPDEAVVTEKFVSNYGSGVGDTVTAVLPTPAQARAVTINPPRPEGPRVPIHIVGVVRSPWFSDDAASHGRLLPTPALLAHYRANLFSEQYGWFDALVRLRGGEADIATFTDHLVVASGNSDVIVKDLVEDGRHRQRAAAFEARWLIALGAAALVAGIVLVGQAVARHVAGSVARAQVLRALGMTPRQTLVAESAGPLIAACIGATVAATAAWYASAWFPVGVAADTEPEPGRRFDVLVLGCGWLVAVGLVVLGAAMTGRSSLAARRSATHHRVSAIAGRAARAHLPVPVVIGTRFALEAGRGRTTVPVRQALLAAVAGVIGVVAAFTFSAGVSDAAGSPARFGQTHQLEMWSGFEGHDFVAPSALEVVARDRDVTGVNDWHYAAAGLPGGSSLPVSSYAPVGKPMRVVVLSGRMPATPREIALAPNSAAAADAHVGSLLHVTGTRQRLRLRVTGLAFVTQGSHCTRCTDHATGAWVTAGGFRALFEHFQFRIGAIQVRAAADVDAVGARLEHSIAAAPGGQDVTIGRPFPPSAAAEIRRLRALPIALGVFLMVLAAGAVGHALLSAVRRRRQELAVLRALGMTGRQVRWVVVTHASVTALVGLAFGIPLGLALGRVAWRTAADYAPLEYVPPNATWALLLVGPLALIVANLLAAWPGHRAARLAIAEILRTE